MSKNNFELLKSLREMMPNLSWFERRRILKVMKESDPTLSASKSGANPLLALKYLPDIEKFLNEYERVENAGACYVPGDGPTGDGTLAITNSRIIFVFDEDFEKDPWFIYLDQVLEISFGPTELVPISELMSVRYSVGSSSNAKDIVVGRFFAQEIRNAFNG